MPKLCQPFILVQQSPLVLNNCIPTQGEIIKNKSNFHIRSRISRLRFWA